MTDFLAKHAAELLARDLAADDSHAMRKINDIYAGRIGRGHLDEFIETKTPVSPDVPDVLIESAGDVRAHILAIASHPHTMAAYFRETGTVMLVNPVTLTFAVHSGRHEIDEATGLGNVDGGSVYPLSNRTAPLKQILRKFAVEGGFSPAFNIDRLAENLKMAQETLDYQTVAAAREEVVKAAREASNGSAVIVMSGGLSALSRQAPEAIAGIMEGHKDLPAKKAAQAAKTAAVTDPVLGEYTRVFLADTGPLKEASNLSKSLNLLKKNVDRAGDPKGASAIGRESAALVARAEDLRAGQKDALELMNGVLRAERDGKDSAVLLASFARQAETYAGKMEALKSALSAAREKYADRLGPPASSSAPACDAKPLKASL